MQTFDDSPFYMAATLAINLMNERVEADEEVAADIAWQTYKSSEAQVPQAMFQAEDHGVEVKRAMGESGAAAGSAFNTRSDWSRSP